MQPTLRPVEWTRRLHHHRKHWDRVNHMLWGGVGKSDYQPWSSQQSSDYRCKIEQGWCQAGTCSGSWPVLKETSVKAFWFDCVILVTNMLILKRACLVPCLLLRKARWYLSVVLWRCGAFPRFGSVLTRCRFISNPLVGLWNTWRAVVHLSGQYITDSTVYDDNCQIGRIVITLSTVVLDIFRHGRYLQKNARLTY